MKIQRIALRVAVSDNEYRHISGMKSLIKQILNVMDASDTLCDFCKDDIEIVCNFIDQLDKECDITGEEE